MTISRKQQVDLTATPYYHCITRCVRRAFLCGDDEYSGKNFDHRREWIAGRINQLSGIFLIEISAYAVMSNHYHLILRVNLSGAAAMSDHEVVDRWHCNPPLK